MIKNKLSFLNKVFVIFLLRLKHGHHQKYPLSTEIIPVYARFIRMERKVSMREKK